MTRLIALLCAIAAAAALRLVPHPPNFSPIDAMALFSGAYLSRRWIAFAAPLAALLLSDLVLGFYSGMLFQYAAVVLIALLGMAALSRVTVLRLAGAAVASSLLFFLSIVLIFLFRSSEKKDILNVDFNRLAPKI